MRPRRRTPQLAAITTLVVVCVLGVAAILGGSADSGGREPTTAPVAAQQEAALSAADFSVSLGTAVVDAAIDHCILPVTITNNSGRAASSIVVYVGNPSGTVMGMASFDFLPQSVTVSQDAYLLSTDGTLDGLPPDASFGVTMVLADGQVLVTDDTPGSSASPLATPPASAVPQPTGSSPATPPGSSPPVPLPTAPPSPLPSAVP